MQVLNETGTLKKVLLHRPGNELKILNEENKLHYLFDEIPNLEISKKEHDIFSKLLINEGTEVLYIEDLMAEVIKNKDVKESFIKDYLNETNCRDEEIYNYLLSIKDEKDLVLETMSGIKDKVDAMPNLYFTRDPFTIIGNGIALYHMHTNVRNREVIYGEYINKYHKDFNLEVLYDRNYKYEIEGGDVLILNKDTILIGISERSTLEAAKLLASNLLSKTKFKNIVTIAFPKKRACMHLDTVMTMINDKTFSLYDEFYNEFEINIINKDGLTKTNDELEFVLSKLLNKDIKLIRSSRSDEQWNDAYNTLAVSPNKVVVYDVNNITNNEYIKHDVKLIQIPSKELLKGRGGAHCMSMPLLRED